MQPEETAGEALERVDSHGRDHSIMLGAVKRFTNKTVAVLVVIEDGEDGADHDVYFVGIPKGEGYKKLGALQSGIAFVQDDLFAKE